MKAIICLPVDFRTNSLGLPSLLEEEIDGAPVLYHTVSRLTLSDAYRVVLLFNDGPEAEESVSRTRGLLDGLEYETFVSDAADVPNRQFLRRARLWSANSWRGGIGATCYWDEAGAPGAMLAAAERFDADSVGLVTPDSPYADPNLAARLFEWHYDRIRKARVTVTGVPPGLAPAVFNSEMLRTFAENDLTLAAAFAYKPAQPQRDVAATEAHFEADLELRLAPWRLTAHSLRQLEMMRALAREGVSPRGASGMEVIQALGERPGLWSGAVPAKIEIEPTTRIDAAPEYLREFAASREQADISADAFGRILSSMAPHRDVVVSLEGLGEPLLHADLPGLVAAARSAGAMGVHAGTFGRLLDEAVYDRLVEARLDVLSVNIGAHSPERYAELFGTDGLEKVRRSVEALFSRRRESMDTWPLIVAEITKTRAMEADLEEFFDHWFANCDWPVIRPYNDFAGQLEDRATIHMRTSKRIPCRKIYEELYIDAAGTAYPCRQDIMKTRPLGNAAECGIGALWHSDFMEELREAHERGDYEFFGLCRNCKDWYYA